MDILWFVVIKNKPLSGFWRIYDVCLHCLLFTYLAMHFTLSFLRQRNSCYVEENNSLISNATIATDVKTHHDLKSDCNKLDMPASFSEVIFATGKYISFYNKEMVLNLLIK